MKKYIALILSVLMIAASLAACGEETVYTGTTTVETKAPTEAPTQAPPATVDEQAAGVYAGVLRGEYTSVEDVPAPNLDAGNTDYQNAAPKAGDVVAVMHTNKGDIKIRFFYEIAPMAVNNFIALAKAGKYDNTIFHRVTKVETSRIGIIQGGDYTNFNGTGGGSIYGQSFGYEISDYTLNNRGSVAMAHSSLPDSNGSQFYINTANNNALDGDYTVFAQVYEGMDVVDAIASVDIANEKPAEQLDLYSVEIINYVG